MAAALMAAAALLGAATPARGQVAPGDVPAAMLDESVRAVLGVPAETVAWKAVPLRAQDRAAVRPRLKMTRRLPDTLYVGRVETEKGPRFLIPDAAPSKAEVFSLVLYLDAQGAVVDVDVLKYRENYGYQIDYPIFRRQFHGKKAPRSIVFRRTIQNISGATISARSLTYTVRDLLALTQQVGMSALQ